MIRMIHYINIHQFHSAMRLMLDWSMVQQLTKDELRYVRVGCGALCVTMTGIIEMQMWFVNSWDMTDVSSVYWIIIIYAVSSTASTAHIPLQNRPITSKATQIHHLNKVNCSGDEEKLSECTHSETGGHYCSDEAGVTCSSKPF